MQTTETWQHRDIITNGIRMHYVKQGEGPLIVLLHGFPEFWYSWRYQIPFLAEHGYTVVAPDLRGYNETDKPRKGYDIPTLLRDIVGLVKGLGQQKASIVGHDWGGVLAWAFAMNKPGAIKAAISYYRQLFWRLPFSFKSYEVQIDAPTLLIWGEKDIALGIELTTGLERWVNNIQIKRIPDSGHWVQQEQPEKVNQLILDFLQTKRVESLLPPG